jgi:clan AA aspartic protease
MSAVAIRQPVVCHPSHVRRYWGDQPMGEIRVDVTLANAIDASLAAEGKLAEDDVRIHQGSAMVDTGAIMTVVPQHVADQLGLMVTSQRKVTRANGSNSTVDVIAPVYVEIMGRDTYEDCLVMCDDVPNGETILEKTDLFIDCAIAKVVPNPAHPDEPVLYVK